MCKCVHGQCGILFMYSLYDYMLYMLWCVCLRIHVGCVHIHCVCMCTCVGEHVYVVAVMINTTHNMDDVFVHVLNVHAL